MNTVADSEDSSSAAWINRWKIRHNIVFRKICSESVVCECDLDEWMGMNLRQILSTFLRCDIYDVG